MQHLLEYIKWVESESKGNNCINGTMKQWTSSPALWHALKCWAGSACSILRRRLDLRQFERRFIVGKSIIVYKSRQKYRHACWPVRRSVGSAANRCKVVQSYHLYSIKWLVWKVWNWCKSYAVALMVTRSQPVWTRPVDFGPMCQTALCLTKTPNLGLSVGRVVFQPSIRVSEAKECESF